MKEALHPPVQSLRCLCTEWNCQDSCKSVTCRSMYMQGNPVAHGQPHDVFCHVELPGRASRQIDRWLLQADLPWWSTLETFIHASVQAQGMFFRHIRARKVPRSSEHARSNREPTGRLMLPRRPRAPHCHFRLPLPTQNRTQCSPKLPGLSSSRPQKRSRTQR